ncbi:MAG: type 1 glutamine amidotransferase family protein [Methanoregula sp.]|jgi:putative intracellular protease/amidase|uniref:type 1 glutamine amidotransferase family protein n=1 Tax=Methanoregula sp. TaxID=2052170 RepID=UPI003C1EC5D8
MEKNVYLFVCPEIADWEPALAVAMISDRYTEIPKTHSYPVITFGLTREPVKTFGGLTILPDVAVDDIDLEKTAMIILPGSSLYEKKDPARLVPPIESCIRNDIPVAAICGATLFLAKHGFLDSVRHTSAGPAWLKKHASLYRGEGRYVHALSVADRGIITANPPGFVEFAYNIIKTLDVLKPEFLEFWLGAVKRGNLNTDSF